MHTIETSKEVSNSHLLASTHTQRTPKPKEFLMRRILIVLTVGSIRRSEVRKLGFLGAGIAGT